MSNDLIYRHGAVDAIRGADVCMAWNGDISAEDATDLAVRATKRSVIDSIGELPSAQQSRLERAVAGKSPEEIYDFLYWLMFDHARAYTDSRAAVIAWLKGE